MSLSIFVIVFSVCVTWKNARALKIAQQKKGSMRCDHEHWDELFLVFAL